MSVGLDLDELCGALMRLLKDSQSEANQGHEEGSPEAVTPSDSPDSDAPQSASQETPGEGGSGTTVPVPVLPAAVPCQLVDAKVKGVHLDVAVTLKQLVPVAEYLSTQGFAIDTVTGVDWPAEEQMEVVYDFFHPHNSARVAVRTRVPRGQPELPTISGVFPGANWHERETHDFFGIRFTGHPDLTPLLLPEDADYHPLRKDFTGAA